MDSKVITTQPAPLASKDEEFDIDYDKVGIEEKLITKEVITSAKQQVLKEVQVQQKPQTKKVAVDKKVCMNVGEESVNLSPCPHCEERCSTRLEYKSSTYTVFWAIFFCITMAAPCIPFCCNCFLNVEHYCSSCDNYIGTYIRNGGSC